ncbi:MAG: hypothetical protein AB8F95_08995 [Bacteroidia bacterium]
MQHFDFDRKRDFGALIEDAFKVNLKYLGGLLKYLLIFVAPLMIASSIILAPLVLDFQTSFGAIAAGGGMDSPQAMLDAFSGLINWRLFLTMAIGLIAGPVGFLIVTGFYNHVREHRTEPDNQWMISFILGNLGKMIGLYLLLGILYFGLIIVFVFLLSMMVDTSGGSTQGIAAAVGMIFLVMVPFFCLITFLAVRISLSPIALVTDSEGITESIRTSWKLTKGSFWKIFGAIIVVSMAVGLLIGFVGMAIGAVLLIGGLPADSLGYVTTTQITNNLLNLLSVPFIYSILILMYYSFRPGKGGMEGMIDEIGADDFFGNNDE